MEFRIIIWKEPKIISDTDHIQISTFFRNFDNYVSCNRDSKIYSKPNADILALAWEIKKDNEERGISKRENPLLHIMLDMLIDMNVLTDSQAEEYREPPMIIKKDYINLVLYKYDFSGNTTTNYEAFYFSAYKNAPMFLHLQNKKGKFYKILTVDPVSAELVVSIREECIKYFLYLCDVPASYHPLVPVLLDSLIDNGVITEEQTLPYRRG